MLRVFIAVDIEDPLLLSRIERIKDSVVSTGVPMKPVETENLHITLRFIGEVPVGVVEEIKREVLQGLAFRSFTVRLVGLGAFPSPMRPRVVWIGVREGVEELRALRDEIERGLRRLGVRPDDKEFHPHLTLARIKGSRNLQALVKLINEMQDYEVGSFTVTSVRLKKSTLTRRGPIYETLMEVKSS